MKTVIGKFPLESVDVQGVEVPKGSKLLSVASQIEQVSSVVGLDGKRSAHVSLNMFIGFDPEQTETEQYSIYILGLGTEVDLPETATLVGVCPVMGGQLVFHIFTDKVVV